MFNTPKSVSWLPIVSNASLAVLKLVTAVIIGSVSVLSDGLDSSVDVLSAFIVFVGIRIAARPPDQTHPYGHGKAEYLSGLTEAVLILGGGSFVTYQAISRLINGTEISRVELGIGVLVISLLVNTGVAAQLHRVAKRYSSVALEAAAKHRASDMLTSFGVLAGLVIVKFTSLDILDPIIALGVAGVIFWAGFSIAWKSLNLLMDPGLADSEEEELVALMISYPDVIDVIRLQTGMVGDHRRIDATLVMCRDLTVGDAHNTTNRIEANLLSRYPKSWISIHVAPCADSQDGSHSCSNHPRARPSRAAGSSDL